MLALVFCLFCFVLGGMGDGERLRERRGCEGLRDCVCLVCVCARVCIQGRRSDRVRHVMHYQIRLYILL